MAKSNKSQIPKINPPNSGLRSWLNQGSQETTEYASDASSPKEITTPVETETSKPAMSAETQEVKPPQPVADVAVEVDREQINKDDSIKGETEAFPVEAAPTSEVVSALRKPKNRGGEGQKASYLETFFKKPVKANGTSLASEGKPIRVTEESHLLLSVLVSEARRQGYKLNVGDFVDNLLANHRLEHKREVDELIATWKTRKSFD